MSQVSRHVQRTVLTVCLAAGLLAATPVHAQEGTASGDPGAASAPYRVFLPTVQNTDLTGAALTRVAAQTGIPGEQLQIVDRTEIIYPSLGLNAYEFSIQANQSGEVYVLTLDAAGAEVDRAALDAAETAAYNALGDYEIAVEEAAQPLAAPQPTPETEEPEEPADMLEPSALGSDFMPYSSTKTVKMGFEYRPSTTSKKCLSAGIISIRMQTLDSRTDSAKLNVIVEKCKDKEAFGKDGAWEILVNGVSRFGTFRVAHGQLSASATINPLHESWYDTKTTYTYQIRYLTTGENSYKYSGKVTTAVWGRCWCTDYAYQRLGLKFGGYGNAKDWGSLLLNNGYRKLKTVGSGLETPRVGDVVVLQPGFPSAPSAGHVGIIQSIDGSWRVKLDQGGSAASDWRQEYYCYNARTQAWGTSIKNNSYAAVYRK